LIDLNQIDPAPIRYDLDEIVRRLRSNAERWVPALFPKGRRQGDEWRLANIQGAPPRKSGSCVIMLRGDHAGDWHDFDGGQGGGPLATLAQGTGRASPAGRAMAPSGRNHRQRQSRNAMRRSTSPLFVTTPQPSRARQRSATLKVAA